MALDAAGAVGSPEPTAPADPTTWGAHHAHDPTVVRADDGTYVMFSTDAFAGGTPPAGAHLRTSRDLVTWVWAGTALDGVPAEAHAWSGAPGLWAPEVVRWDERTWHMYYSASTFGSNTSAIGLATAPDPRGPWTAGPLVVRTRAGEQTQNAIDAAVVREPDGAPWLVYGSFFSGIYALRLDPATGLAADDGDLGVCVARRNRSVEGAVEGAYVVRRDSSTSGPQYWMFLSYDSLFNAYHVRVGVAEHPAGPYLDRDGRDLTDVDSPPQRVGTSILEGHALPGEPPLIAPGHASVLRLAASEGPDGVALDLDGVDLLVHHVREADDPHQHHAQLRRLVWTASGWPAVAPLPYRGEDLVSGRPTGPDTRLAGTWDVLDLRLAADAGPTGPIRHAAPWTSADGDLRAFGDVVVVPGRDADGRDVLTFTGYTVDRAGVSGVLRGGDREV
ncbi:hypothetical protein GCM10011331_07510 [Flavimobilis marinus]|uniref:Arabinan endo-1,5-alpha-L-arabinosidase n=1 Tax=Flavimobilis marinus TaxID=285351 RepID=A0A1I2CS01_9MICO|nr:arabinan endo-1,5-alpha-L-arabinosidase [Flavimobilis marinus]GHG47040.1 hypothetical protein GCM10011331_07510 [Flavimobilis marinus]SFE71119.1 arabinan endo-1,5-alpha-L-arabinosidase [Flavimobilis marinus]